MSAASRQAVLNTAADLLDERGFPGFTVDEVARRSGVSKATIYRHWTSGFTIAVEAYGDRVTDAVPVLPTGDAVADLRNQVVRLARFYGSARGRVAAQLLAASIGVPGGPAVVRATFFAQRRSATAALIDRGRADGQLRADLDTELAIDLLFGPIVFRLFNGEPALKPAAARRLADLALRAIVVPAVDRASE